MGSIHACVMQVPCSLDSRPRPLLRLPDSDGWLSDWDLFLDNVEPMTRTTPVLTLAGNHERDG